MTLCAVAFLHLLGTMLTVSWIGYSISMLKSDSPAKDGIYLIFVSYPAAFSMRPLTSIISATFFFTLLLMGLTSQVSICSVCLVYIWWLID